MTFTDNTAMQVRPSQLLTLAEVSHELNLSERTIRRHIAKGLIVAVRVGGQWRVARGTVDAIRLLGTAR